MAAKAFCSFSGISVQRATLDDDDDENDDDNDDDYDGDGYNDDDDDDDGDKENLENIVETSFLSSGVQPSL